MQKVRKPKEFIGKNWWGVDLSVVTQTFKLWERKKWINSLVSISKRFYNVKHLNVSHCTCVNGVGH